MNTIYGKEFASRWLLVYAKRSER